MIGRSPGNTGTTPAAQLEPRRAPSPASKTSRPPSPSVSTAGTNAPTPSPGPRTPTTSSPTPNPQTRKDFLHTTLVVFRGNLGPFLSTGNERGDILHQHRAPAKFDNGAQMVQGRLEVPLPRRDGPIDCSGLSGLKMETDTSTPTQEGSKTGGVATAMGSGCARDCGLDCECGGAGAWTKRLGRGCWRWIGDRLRLRGLLIAGTHRGGQALTSRSQPHCE